MIPIFLGAHNYYPDAASTKANSPLAIADTQFRRQVSETMANPMFHFRLLGTPYSRTKQLLKWEMEDAKAKETGAMFRTAVELSLLGNDKRYMKDANFMRDLEFAKVIGGTSVNVGKHMNYAGDYDALGRQRFGLEKAIAEAREQNFGIEMATTQNSKDLKQDTDEHYLRMVLLDFKAYDKSTNPSLYAISKAAQKLFPRFVNDAMKKPDIISSAFHLNPAKDGDAINGIIHYHTAPLRLERDKLTVDNVKDIQKNIARLMVLHHYVTHARSDTKSARAAAKVLLQFFPGDEGLEAIRDMDKLSDTELRKTIETYKNGKAAEILGEIEEEPHFVLMAAELV